MFEESFPISTEIQQGRMQALINKAPEGILLTVGGERAFRDGAMFEKITHLVILDIDADVMRFNLINKELLKSPTLAHYKTLRWESSFDEWQNVSPDLAREDFDWWQQNIRALHPNKYSIPQELYRFGKVQDSQRFQQVVKCLRAIFNQNPERYNKDLTGFLQFATWDLVEDQIDQKPGAFQKEDMIWFAEEREKKDSCVTNLLKNPDESFDLGAYINYREGHYLFDEALYARIHKLAVSGKITVLEANLGTDKGVALVKKTLEKSGGTLAVLDLNNLYHIFYMKEQAYREAIEGLLPYGRANSVLVAMHNYLDLACAQFSIYVGFTFENVKTWPKGVFLAPFFRQLPTSVAPLLDGRFFVGDDQFPATMN